MADFERLEPKLILSAIESAGYLTTGEYTQLNSYENRVFSFQAGAMEVRDGCFKAGQRD